MLADLTTLRLGGPAARVVTTSSSPELVAAVRAADAVGEPVLLVGGGSNLVVADEGWPGVAVLIRGADVGVRRVDDEVRLQVAAGTDWDGLAARAVDEGWGGIESLSGIPGLTGATPVQNVGAYGQDVSQTVTDVTVWDRTEDRIVVLTADECGFGYRTSTFKHTDRYVVLAVGFRLSATGVSGPIRYAELARVLGADDAVPLADVRAAVLDLRRGKGMLLDPADHDTWSAGSFFTNPILAPAELADFESRAGPAYPSWPDALGRKLSAAWLIERAGFGKGYGDGRAGLSSKHTLALSNRGGASTAELLALARELRDGVRVRFGVELRAEPRLVGCDL